MAEHNPILDIIADSPDKAPTSVGVPVFDDPKLAAIDSAIANATASTTAAISAQKTAIGQASDLSTVIVGAIEDISESNRIIKAQRVKADLNAQRSVSAGYRASGGIELQTQLLGELNVDSQRTADLLDQRADIRDDEITGIAFFDAIINEFRSIQTDIDLEGATAQEAHTLQRIQNITAATESLNSAVSISKEVLNKSVTDAMDKQLADETSKTVSENKLQDLYTHAETMLRLATMTSSEVNNLIKAQQLRYSEQSLAIQGADFEFRKGIRLDKEQLDNVRFVAVNNALSMGGLPPLTIQEVTSGFQIQTEKFITLANQGALDIPVLGNTLAEAQFSRKLTDPSGLAHTTPAMEWATEIERNFLDLLTRGQKAGGISELPLLPRDQAIYDTALNSYADEVYNIKAAEIIFGANDNPFQAPPMETLLAKSGVAAEAFIVNIIKPLGMTETNPQRIFDHAVSALLDRKLSPEDAASGFANLFLAARAHNSSDRGGFGRVGMKPQDRYMGRINVPTVIRTSVRGIGVASSASTESKLLDLSNFSVMLVEFVKAMAAVPKRLIPQKDNAISVEGAK